MNHRMFACTVAAVWLSAFAALADEPAPEPARPAAGPTAAEKKAKYALPYAMRPAIAPNLVRIDASYAGSEVEAAGRTTKFAVVSSILTAGYKPIPSLPDLGFYVRGAFVKYSVSPETTPSTNGSAFSNPLFFALYTPEIAPKFRLPLFVGLTAPIGSGSGNDPDKAKRAAVGSGIYSRQAMDNALFATNYMTPTVGAGLAWVDKGWTVQAEATVLFLRRVKGEKLDDSARTNFTAGLNAGYQVLPFLTVSAELHYQRWLSTPTMVTRDEAKPSADRLGLRDQLTAGVGVRANLPLDKSTILRPGLAYFRGLDDPMAKQKYSIIQLDVAVAF
mgnify:CR=1 FL=1